MNVTFEMKSSKERLKIVALMLPHGGKLLDELDKTKRDFDNSKEKK